MGARTFTDSEGNKYELATNCWDEHSGELHIKPIKAVEKKLHELWFHRKDSGIPGVENIDAKTFCNIKLELTEPTAQKVAEAIDALIRYIQGEGNDNGQWPAVVSKARAALQEDV